MIYKKERPQICKKKDPLISKKERPQIYEKGSHDK
jgi:hypothetical protein